jgi:hypothetical protein
MLEGQAAQPRGEVEEFGRLVRSPARSRATMKSSPIAAPRGRRDQSPEEAIMDTARARMSYFVLCAAALAALWTTASTAQEPSKDAPLRFEAVAVNTSNVGRQGLTQVEIAIERWTSDDEFARLRDALVEKGPEDLLSQIQKIKPRAGYIRASGGLGWDIQYARKRDLPGGGHRIVFATDRPMSFYETSNQTRTSEYAFVLGELRIGPNGKGEGKLAPMARIDYDKDSHTLEIENYANTPVMLNDVTEQGTAKSKDKK